MEKKPERSKKIWAQVSCWSAALALVLLFSCPGAAAIKRFKDESGTLHISNEGGEGKPPTTISTPPKRPASGRGSWGHPRRGVPPRPPAHVAPPKPANAPKQPPPPPDGHAPR